MADQFMPVVIALITAGFISTCLLGTAALLGQRTRQRSILKRRSYESGVPRIDRDQKRISVKFYLVALVFVVLDVEVAFLYPWAINYRFMADDVSLSALLEIVAFLAPLVVAYLYLWRKGIFDWGSRRATTIRRSHHA
jgi:NADH:ubiquinone oxidoreductase subunit 3 (subunit A)